jgi:hypothetical protein
LTWRLQHERESGARLFINFLTLNNEITACSRLTSLFIPLFWPIVYSAPRNFIIYLCLRRHIVVCMIYTVFSFLLVYGALFKWGSSSYPLNSSISSNGITPGNVLNFWIAYTSDQCQASPLFLHWPMRVILIKYNQVVLKITLIPNTSKLFHGGMYKESLIVTFINFLPL